MCFFLLKLPHCCPYSASPLLIPRAAILHCPRRVETGWEGEPWFPKAQSTEGGGVDWSITIMFEGNRAGDKKRFPTRQGEYLQAGSRKRTRAGGSWWEQRTPQGPGREACSLLCGKSRDVARFQRSLRLSLLLLCHAVKTKMADRATWWCYVHRNKEHWNSNQCVGPRPKTRCLALVFGTRKNLWGKVELQTIWDRIKMFERNRI